MRFPAIVVLVLAFAFSIFAQEKSSAPKSSPNEIKQTTKFAEFGDICEKEFAPKLKEYAAALKKTRVAQGYVLFYNSVHNPPFKQTSYFVRRKTYSYARYLSDGHGSMRMTFVEAGFREKMTTELWIVPVGGKAPESENFIEATVDLRLKIELLPTKQLDFSEAKIKKDIEEDLEDAESYTETRKSDGEDFQEKLAEVLGKDKTWRAVVIFYADDSEYDISKARQIIEKLLKEEAELDLKRVKLIYGGYRENTEIESWIIPKDGIEPEAMPDEKIEEN